MQTNFTSDQLKDPKLMQANKILRSCVHCGMCTATCPTYQVLGDELDSPRGRIYLIKDMLENQRVPDAKTVMHLDRCLSCLACKTTCPSGVDYMHLIDQARAYVTDHYKRPFIDRMLRRVLAALIPYPNRFRLALLAGKLAKPFAWAMPDARLRAMINMAPKTIAPPSPNDDPQSFAPLSPPRHRVILMTGCAQKALNTKINDATINVLRKLGCEVIISEGAGCCGALTHHMGLESQSHASAAANARVWYREHQSKPVDAIIINTSGCGTTLKDYAHMLKGTSDEDAATWVAGAAMDISEWLAKIGIDGATAPAPLTVGYHAACSLQHGQQVKFAPKDLLRACGFTIAEPKEAHLCCGSAGTYNLLQPEISGALKDRKIKSLEAIKPDVIAAGNIGCMMQISSGTQIPMVHTIELIDWALGGENPIDPSSS